MAAAPSVPHAAPVAVSSAVGVSRATLIAAIVTAVVVLVVAVAAIDASPVAVVHDDGMYTVLAKSLATGHGYRWIHLPGAPQRPQGLAAALRQLGVIAIEKCKDEKLDHEPALGKPRHHSPGAVSGVEWRA